MSVRTATNNPHVGWRTAVQTGAALAAAMGVGRFVFTPVIPLMESHVHLAPASASAIATSNYLGYLVGALLGIAVPVLSRARAALRVSAVILVVTLLAMPLSTTVSFWILDRGIAGVASAIVFMVAGNAILTELASRKPHLVGWAYGGIGTGIALSGALVAVIARLDDWHTAWWASAVLAAVLLAVSWPVGDRGGVSSTLARKSTPAESARPRYGRWFVILALSYFFEGAGYIIAGTFLVAAVSASGPAWLGSSVWTIVGLAAVPSCVAWTWLSVRFSRPSLIAGALVLQAIGIALPAVSGTAPAAIVAAILFGATFVGITTLVLATGRHLRVPRAVAILTAGYGIGQVIGPLVVAPTLDHGYRPALLVGAVIVLVAGLGAAALRHRFPHEDQPHRGTRLPHLPEPVPTRSAREEPLER